MSGWDGNGNYVRFYSWVQDKANGINPSSSRFDTEDNGFATQGFGNCVTRDGQGKASATQSPATDNSYDLGTAVLRWRNLYCTGFSGGPSFAGLGTPAGPSLQAAGGDYQIDMYQPSAGTDLKHTFLRQEAGSFAVTFMNDALSSGNNVFVIGRSGDAATAYSGYGPMGAAPVDMTPDRASWTSTFSGPYTSNPSGTLTWERHGNHVEVFVNALISGTATNASSFITASGLPAVITPTTLRYCPCFGIALNGASPASGLVVVNTNGTLTISPMGTGASAGYQIAYPSGSPCGVAPGFAFRYCL